MGTNTGKEDRLPELARTARPDRVVLTPPSFNQDFRVPKRVEDLPVEQFVAQFPVERLDITVLPRTARLDEQRLHAYSPQPAAPRLGRRLRPIVGTDVIRHATADEQVAQPFQHVLAVSPGRSGSVVAEASSWTVPPSATVYGPPACASRCAANLHHRTFHRETIHRQDDAP